MESFEYHVKERGQLQTQKTCIVLYSISYSRVQYIVPQSIILWLWAKQSVI